MLPHTSLRLVARTGLFLALAALPASADEEPNDGIDLRFRGRVVDDSGAVRVVEKKARWGGKDTAVIICDMWNEHWCRGATRRVAEMAPRMNAVIQKARAAGMLIIHAPSGVLEAYKDTPQRKLAQSAPAATPKVPLRGWCSLDKDREGELPIDDSDGGCDCVPQCASRSAWSKQIDTLEIAEGDAITDSAEAYNLLEERGIDNVIVMGVHTNMCVLGRPFSIRQMVYQDKNVALVRDLTDTMYNPRMRPYVNHFLGTDLVVEHIEKFWCPTVTSADFLGGEPFRFRNDVRPKVVFLIGEREYDTKTTLPRFIETVLVPNGIRPAVVHVSDDDPNHFPGLETALEDADALFISVRRRTPPTAQLEAIRAFIASGKAILGIRTASHAFDRKLPDEHHGRWEDFDRAIFGGHYQGHFGNKPGKGGAHTVVWPAAGAERHPILTGIEPKRIRVTSHLYRNRDLARTTSTLLVGKLEDRPGVEPVAWTNEATQRVFYTSLGNPDDFAEPMFQRLLLNAVLWATSAPIPKKVTLEAPATAASVNDPH